MPSRHRLGAVSEGPAIALRASGPSERCTPPGAHKCQDRGALSMRASSCRKNCKTPPRSGPLYSRRALDQPGSVPALGPGHSPPRYLHMPCDRRVNSATEPELSSEALALDRAPRPLLRTPSTRNALLGPVPPPSQDGTGSAAARGAIGRGCVPRSTPPPCATAGVPNTRTASPLPESGEVTQAQLVFGRF